MEMLLIGAALATAESSQLLSIARMRRGGGGVALPPEDEEADEEKQRRMPGWFWLLMRLASAAAAGGGFLRCSSRSAGLHSGCARCRKAKRRVTMPEAPNGRKPPPAAPRDDPFIADSSGGNQRGDRGKMSPLSSTKSKGLLRGEHAVRSHADVVKLKALGSRDWVIFSGF